MADEQMNMFENLAETLLYNVVRPLVYISSPYTHGNMHANVERQHVLWDELIRKNVAPVAPLWSHYQELYSHDLRWEDWIRYDLNVLRRCDAVLRVDVKDVPSEGVRVECRYAEDHGIPVFDSVDELLEWVEKTKDFTEDMGLSRGPAKGSAGSPCSPIACDQPDCPNKGGSDDG